MRSFYGTEKSHAKVTDTFAYKLTAEKVDEDPWQTGFHAILTNNVFNGITGVSDLIHRPDFNNYKKNEQTLVFLTGLSSNWG
jgi:hypothetical protein